jgi:outer membrane protein assembly factor BamB
VGARCFELSRLHPGVGDFEGYLHWLDKATGTIVARQKADGERITNAAIAGDTGVFVQTDSGKLLAYRSAARAIKTAEGAQAEPAAAEGGP